MPEQPTLTELRRRLRLAATDILSRFGWTGLQVGAGLLSAEPVQHAINDWAEARLPLWVFQVVMPLTIALLKNVAAALVGEEGKATFTSAPAVVEVPTVEVQTPVLVPVDVPAAPSPFTVDEQVDANPFAVVEPPPFREGVEADSGDATPIVPPVFGTEF